MPRPIRAEVLLASRLAGDVQVSPQGYRVIYANPRGSQGYGEQFCQAIRSRWGSHDYADLMAVVDQAMAEKL